MSCECHQIGGRFIAEDPDCPAHGREAQREAEQRESELDVLQREVAAWRERFPAYRFRPQDDMVGLI